MQLVKQALALLLVAAAPPAAAAQQRPAGAASSECVNDRQPVSPRTDHSPAADLRAYDIVVEVPRLCVDRIELKVRNVQAHLALNAQVSNLVQITAGADAVIEQVDLGIYGVDAKALLLVDLDNVVAIVDNTMTFIDNNPQIIASLGRTLTNTVGTVGQVGNTLLQPGGVVGQTVGVVGQTLNNLTAPGGVLTQTVNTLGQTVQRTVDVATGSILERTLDTAGRVLSSRTLGRLADLPLLRETAGSAGQMVREVRDTSGAIVRYTVDSAGKVLNSTVVQQGTQTPPRQ
jgi:hypothetical protein